MHKHSMNQVKNQILSTRKPLASSITPPKSLAVLVAAA